MTMAGIVLTVRFLLEMITVLGLLLGVFVGQTSAYKIGYLILGIGMTFIWSRYGAPKSSHVLMGIYKFILEVAVYAIGSIAFYQLFGTKIGIIYLVIVLVDLLLMYVLELQGN